jgi:outer membrane protein assembly factor BamB
VVGIAPAVGGDVLFVADTEYEGCVRIYDRHTGELVRDLPSGCPTVVGDVLVIADLNAGVTALSLPDLTERWHNKGWTGWLGVSPAVADGIAYAALGFEGNHTHSGLCAYEVTSGREVFQVGDTSEECPLSGGEDWVLFATVHPVVAEGLVWMPLRREHEDDSVHERDPWFNGEVVGLDPLTGERRWHYALDVGEQSEIRAAVAVADGAMFFTAVHDGDSVRNILHSVDISTMSERWVAELSGLATGAPTFAGGHVLVATGAGTVHAFEVATGEPVWTVATGHEIVNEYDLLEDTGSYYEEDGQAVLAGEDRVYVRTGVGIVALAWP